jgi:hypothetical protein
VDKLTVYYDTLGKTLTIWLGDPETEESCDEVGDDVILMKNSAGHIIGLEKLDVSLSPNARGISVEIVPEATEALAVGQRRPTGLHYNAVRERPG